MSEQTLEQLFDEAISIKKQIDELTEKVSGSLLRKLEEVIPNKFKNLDFKCILACGYTPGFNDGDPCVHNFDVQYGDGIDDLDEFYDFFLEENIEHSDMESENINVSVEHGQIIDSFFDGFNLLCSQIEITNFKIKVYKKKDGEIIVYVNDDYDCGY